MERAVAHGKRRESLGKKGRVRGSEEEHESEDRSGGGG